MINPIPMGMFVVPTWNQLTKLAEGGGTKWPIATPIVMARKIQSVRNRSRNDSFLRAAGAQFDRGLQEQWALTNLAGSVGNRGWKWCAFQEGVL